MRGRGVLLALALALLVTGACGRGAGPAEESSAPPTGATSATSATTAARTDVPDVVVRDVVTGADVNLRALGLPERPTLYWFWAPH